MPTVCHVSFLLPWQHPGVTSPFYGNDLTIRKLLHFPWKFLHKLPLNLHVIKSGYKYNCRNTQSCYSQYSAYGIAFLYRSSHRALTLPELRHHQSCSTTVSIKLFSSTTDSLLNSFLGEAKTSPWLRPNLGVACPPLASNVGRREKTVA